MTNLKTKYSDDLVDITSIPKKTVLRDWREQGVRIVILRGTFSMNVYLGIPNDHALAGHSYDDLPIECHGGLTFAGKGDRQFLPEGYYWYGYDYAHLGDYCWYDHDTSLFADDKKWSLGEIVSDAWSAIYDFKKLVKLAESIELK